MPLTYEEAKHEILHLCNGNIDCWYAVVGAMFEASKGFTNSTEIKRTIDGVSYDIAWMAYDYCWHIEEGR